MNAADVRPASLEAKLTPRAGRPLIRLIGARPAAADPGMPRASADYYGVSPAAPSATGALLDGDADEIASCLDAFDAVAGSLNARREAADEPTSTPTGLWR